MDMKCLAFTINTLRDLPVLSRSLSLPAPIPCTPHLPLSLLHSCNALATNIPRGSPHGEGDWVGQLVVEANHQTQECSNQGCELAHL